MNKERIFLDNASTTNLSAEVLNTMLPVMTNVFGNSQSNHSFGQEASKLIENAKKKIDLNNLTMEDMIKQGLKYLSRN